MVIIDVDINVSQTVLWRYMCVCVSKASMVTQMIKNPPAVQETWVQSLGQDNPCRRKWQPTPVFLPGKSHGQRSQAGYGPWGHKRVRHNIATKRLRVYMYTFVYLCFLGKKL